MSPLNPQPEGLPCCSLPSGLSPQKQGSFLVIHNWCDREWSIERILCIFVESQFCWHHLHDFRQILSFSEPQFESESVSHSAMSDSLWPHGLQPTRLLCPRDSPGKNTRMSCHSLLQGISPTQALNPYLQHGRQIPYHLSPWHILLIFKDKKTGKKKKNTRTVTWPEWILH